MESRQATRVPRRRSLSQRSGRVSLLLTLPAFALAAIFIVYPVFETVQLSFASWDGLGPIQFVGWLNYQNVLGDTEFLTAIRNNLFFAVVVTLGTVVLGCAFALVIDRRVRLWRLYKFVYFLPIVLPMTIVAVMWANALDPHYGSVNWILGLINPNWPTAFLSDPGWAMITICLVAIWQFSGFTMVIVLGGLKNIPEDVQEAATLDGVSPLQRAVHISLPLSRDVIATVTLLQIIFSFKVFDLVQAMTRGGPGTSTQVLGTLIYRDAFVLGNFGYASTIALLATVVIVSFTIGYLRLIRPSKIQRHA